MTTLVTLLVIFNLASVKTFAAGMNVSLCIVNETPAAGTARWAAFEFGPAGVKSGIKAALVMPPVITQSDITKVVAEPESASRFHVVGYFTDNAIGKLNKIKVDNPGKRMGILTGDGIVMIEPISAFTGYRELIRPNLSQNEATALAQKINAGLKRK